MYLVGDNFLCLGMGDSTLFTVASSKRFRRTYSDDMMADISGAPIIKRHKRDKTPCSKRRTSTLQRSKSRARLNESLALRVRSVLP